MVPHGSTIRSWPQGVATSGCGGSTPALADRATELVFTAVCALRDAGPEVVWLNDSSRPTICLVHGLNSSSERFIHMIPWLEEAGLRDRGRRLSV